MHNNLYTQVPGKISDQDNKDVIWTDKDGRTQQAKMASGEIVLHNRPDPNNPSKLIQEDFVFNNKTGREINADVEAFADPIYSGKMLDTRISKLAKNYLDSTKNVYKKTEYQYDNYVHGKRLNKIDENTLKFNSRLLDDKVSEMTKYREIKDLAEANQGEYKDGGPLKFNSPEWKGLVKFSEQLKGPKKEELLYNLAHNKFDNFKSVDDIYNYYKEFSLDAEFYNPPLEIGQNKNEVLRYPWNTYTEDAAKGRAERAKQDSVFKETAKNNIARAFNKDYVLDQYQKSAEKVAKRKEALSGVKGTDLSSSLTQAANSSTSQSNPFNLYPETGPILHTGNGPTKLPKGASLQSLPSGNYVYNGEEYERDPQSGHYFVVKEPIKGSSLSYGNKTNNYKANSLKDFLVGTDRQFNIPNGSMTNFGLPNVGNGSMANFGLPNITGPSVPDASWMGTGEPLGSEYTHNGVQRVNSSNLSFKPKNIYDVARRNDLTLTAPNVKDNVNYDWMNVGEPLGADFTHNGVKQSKLSKVPDNTDYSWMNTGEPLGADYANLRGQNLQPNKTYNSPTIDFERGIISGDPRDMAENARDENRGIYNPRVPSRNTPSTVRAKPRQLGISDYMAANPGIPYNNSNQAPTGSVNSNNTTYPTSGDDYYTQMAKEQLANTAPNTDPNSNGQNNNSLGQDINFDNNYIRNKYLQLLANASMGLRRQKYSPYFMPSDNRLQKIDDRPYLQNNMDAFSSQMKALSSYSPNANNNIQANAYANLMKANSQTKLDIYNQNNQLYNQFLDRQRGINEFNINQMVRTRDLNDRSRAAQQMFFQQAISDAGRIQDLKENQRIAALQNRQMLDMYKEIFPVFKHMQLAKQFQKQLGG